MYHTCRCSRGDLGVGSGGSETCSGPLNTFRPSALSGLSGASGASLLSLLFKSSARTTFVLGKSCILVNGSSLNESEKGSVLSNGSVSAKGSVAKNEPVNRAPCDAGLAMDTVPPECRVSDVMVVAVP